MLARDDLSPFNRSALEALAEAAPRLAELTAADLALADWGLESEDAHDQAGRRVGLFLDVVLCLARRSDRERSLAVTVAGSRATPNALGRDAMDRCRKALRNASLNETVSKPTSRWLTMHLR